MILPTDYIKLNGKKRKEVREEYVERQNNKCMFCNEPLDKSPPSKITNRWIDWTLFPKGFLINKIHLQHNHYTGMTEGAVHAFCNAYLWQYEGK